MRCCCQPTHATLTSFQCSVRISDMGLAKKLDPRQHSFSATHPGSIGWQVGAVVVVVLVRMFVYYCLIVIIPAHCYVIVCYDDMITVVAILASGLI